MRIIGTKEQTDYLLHRKILLHINRKCGATATDFIQPTMSVRSLAAGSRNESGTLSALSELFSVSPGVALGWLIPGLWLEGESWVVEWSPWISRGEMESAGKLVAGISRGFRDAA